MMEEIELLEKQEKQKIIDEIRDKTLYDYICSNKWRIENYILEELLLECIAVIDTEKQHKELIENLKEYKGWDVK